MQVIPYHIDAFNQTALQFAEILGIMMICGLVLAILGKAVFGQKAVRFSFSVGVVIGFFLAFKILF